MTRRTTIFLVCAFEIALILFVAAWSAHAKETFVSCQNGMLYKHNYNLLNSTFEFRNDGEWLPFCECSGQKLTVTRDSAICENTGSELADCPAGVIDLSTKSVLDLLTSTIYFEVGKTRREFACNEQE